MTFGTFYLDQEKDVVIDLTMENGELSYVLRTPYHRSGNLITNLAGLCGLPLSVDETTGLKVVRGVIPCYLDAENREVYILRLGDTKVASFYPDGTMERKATLPAIAKTLMSQTKDYRLSIRQTLVKSYIRRDCKFRTDLHAHMNANLPPDLLIALGIHHQIRYPLYYVRKLSLRLTPAQEEAMACAREKTALAFRDSPLQGKYLERRIDDNTFINLARLLLENVPDAQYNIARIRASLAILKDGQAVFTNLEKVYLYRYVFTRGEAADDLMEHPDTGSVPDPDIRGYLKQMERDRLHPVFDQNTILEDKLLWMARTFRRFGVVYAEISDTTLVDEKKAPVFLRQAHRVLPAVTEETGVVLRFLGAFRRIPLTIIRDRPTGADLSAQLRAFYAAAADPYVAGSDIIGEEMNDIRSLRPLLSALTRIAGSIPGFVLRIHAGENDSLRGNVRNSVRCVLDALRPGQRRPMLRIGHGLYTENLRSEKGRQLLSTLQSAGAVLEFQITSNVRLNNLNSLSHHPLKAYLAAGIPCVQGTDGAGIYGTNSIDEQLSLERMLHLTDEEMRKMRQTEALVLARSLTSFRDKSILWNRETDHGRQADQFYAQRLASCPESLPGPADGSGLSDSRVLLSSVTQELPAGKLPVIVAGGSFGSVRHRTRMRPDVLWLLDRLLDSSDPDRVCFVVGHQLSGYEKYLIERAGGRFQVFAFVPAAITEAEARRVIHSGVRVRVAIETAGFGLYKSFSYEIFKRRPSLLLALDGHSACANMIQEAKNGKYRASIFADARHLELRKKAASLGGYVTLFRDGREAFPLVTADMKKLTEQG